MHIPFLKYLSIFPRLFSKLMYITLSYFWISVSYLGLKVHWLILSYFTFTYFLLLYDISS
jgi:hypothetical protein